MSIRRRLKYALYMSTAFVLLVVLPVAAKTRHDSA